MMSSQLYALGKDQYDPGQRGSLGGLVKVFSQSNKKRKAELRVIDHINLVNAPLEPTISKNAVISFSTSDNEGILYLKNYALVISAIIHGMIVDRILVDNDSFCNIIFKSALD